ncbi:MAG: hypothetical protein JNM97_01635 [Rhodoferax sp.]|jgi:acyl-CoA synthetase (AMP-forming)/AMP-acid ligase II|nr:hypothetical protein [Rhodoferax sp.]
MHAPATAPRIPDLLALAEERSQRLSAALLAGAPDQTAVLSSDLHQVVQALNASLQTGAARASLDPRSRQRLRRLGQEMAQQREACLRRSAVVERSLNSIIPATRTTTYGGGATPYGASARRSGAFKLIAA